MRILALDIGDRRVGMALSDPDGLLAGPLGVFEAKRLENDTSVLGDIVADNEVGLIVVGLPLSLDGTEGPQAERVRVLARAICADVSVPVDWADERLTSIEARRALREGGVPEKRQRGRVDAVAATLMLQAYLDARPPGVAEWPR